MVKLQFIMSFETPKKRVDSSMERGTMSNELAGLDDVRFQIERKLRNHVQTQTRKYRPNLRVF